MVKHTIKKETILKCFVFCLSDLSLPEAAKQFLVAWLTSKPRRRRRPTWRRCCSTSAERCCEQSLRITQRIRPKMTFLVCLFVCEVYSSYVGWLLPLHSSNFMICKLFPICFFDQSFIFTKFFYYANIFKNTDIK
jgi:hypothetical protein